jgi:hypothetical protein
MMFSRSVIGCMTRLSHALSDGGSRTCEVVDMSDTKTYWFDTVRSVGHQQLYPPDRPNTVDINAFRDIIDIGQEL